jgi:hypothetical protein
MVLAPSFDSKGLIHIKQVPRGTTVSVNYSVDALGHFLKVFKKRGW